MVDVVLVKEIKHIRKLRRDEERDVQAEEHKEDDRDDCDFIFWRGDIEYHLREHDRHEAGDRKLYKSHDIERNLHAFSRDAVHHLPRQVHENVGENKTQKYDEVFAYLLVKRRA